MEIDESNHSTLDNYSYKFNTQRHSIKNTKLSSKLPDITPNRVAPQPATSRQQLNVRGFEYQKCNQGFDLKIDTQIQKLQQFIEYNDGSLTLRGMPKRKNLYVKRLKFKRSTVH